MLPKVSRCSSYPMDLYVDLLTVNKCIYQTPGLKPYPYFWGTYSGVTIFDSVTGEPSTVYRTVYHNISRL